MSVQPALDTTVRILVVDDLAEKLLVYRTLLDEPGQQVITAQSGLEALRHLLHDEFAVVLLDVNMPGMDGFETAALIRGRKRCAHTPIIFITAFADEVHAIEGYAHGAVDYILSPVSPDVLRTKVRVFAELFRLSQQVKAQAAREVAAAERERTRLNSVLESATDFVAQADRAGRLLQVNRAGRRMLGLPESDALVDGLIAGHLPWGDYRFLHEGLQIAAREDIWFGETTLLSVQRREIPVSQVVLAHKDASGEVESFSIIARDISLRRRAEQALRESEGRFRAVAMNAPAAIFIKDLEGRYTLANPLACQALGMRDSVVGMTDHELLPADLADRLRRHDAEVIATGGVVEREEVVGLNGSSRDFLSVKFPMLDAAGQPVGVCGVAVDITDRKRMEAVLRDSERRYRQLVHGLPAAVYTCDAAGRITLFNEAAVALWGREPELGLDSWCGSWRIYRPDGTPLPVDECPMAVALREARSVHGEEIVIERPDGSRRNVLPHPQPIFDGSGTLVGAINMLMDITELKVAERALRENESRLRAMFGQAAVGIVLVDGQGRLLEVNERMSQIIGRGADELCTFTCRDLTHPDDWPRNETMFQQVAAGRRSEIAIENRYQRGDGSWVWVTVTVSPLNDDQGQVHRLIGVVEDISARKLAEQEVQRHREHLQQLVHERTAELHASLERLRLSDRLASIGTLAAGLGHDMGNLLLPVCIRVESLERADLSSAAREDVQAIKTASEYLKRLSQGLRLFALDPEEERGSIQHTQMAHWWADVEPFLRNALPKTVVLESRFPADLPALAIRPHQFTQVVYNLVQNAGHALRDRALGKVRIAASWDRNGRFVVVSVTDDGPGMSEEVKRRCMEPFFTTKTRAISTGLGLALVRGTVVKVGGSIEIESKPGEGTTFRLAIPAVRSSANAAEGASPRSVGAACVCMHDQRLGAYVASILQSLDVQVRSRQWSRDLQAELLVMDSPNGHAAEIEEFLDADSRRRAVMVGGTASPSHRQMACIEGKPTPTKIQEVIESTVRELQSTL